MKKLLITGAGGYIGSVLVGECLKQGFSVTAVDRFFFGTERLSQYDQNGALEILKRDIRDLGPNDFNDVYAVIDLAALSNDPCGDLDFGLTFDINRDGRHHVAKTAKDAGVSRYVLASSCSVYGAGASGESDETSQTNPLTNYAKANLEAEDLVLSLNDSSFTVSVLRQATVFGVSPRMRFDLVINIMTLNAVQERKLFVTGGGEQYRPLVHVKDAANGFIAVVNSEKELVAGEIFNIGHSNMQVKAIAQVVSDTIPIPIEIELLPDDPDKRDYLVSFEKIQRQLGVFPKYNPEDGVREVYAAIKEKVIVPQAWNYTVSWYRQLLAAKQLVDDVSLDGRYL